MGQLINFGLAFLFSYMADIGPIGVFDSGLGGLTVLKQFVKLMPGYDFIYLGDNARTPYGTRSFNSVYEFTLEGVRALFENGCPLVILACNTSSAKALRTIQQKDLPQLAPANRVLGVLRPTTEIIGDLTQTKNIGILGTKGTVKSNSYAIEIKKFFPDINVFQQACPMFVPLVENNEHNATGADYFVKKYLDLLFEQCPDIDTILLGCTHYPLLVKKISDYIGKEIKIVTQGEIVAKSLIDYLKRHPEINKKISRTGEVQFLTTDSIQTFNEHAAQFFENPVNAAFIKL